MKACTKCGKTKALESFSPQAENADGRRSWCKPCSAIARAEWLNADPKRVLAANAAKRVWYASKPEHSLAYNRARREAMGPEKVRAMNKRHSLKKYGLTPDAFVSMLVRQDGGCAACGGGPANAKDGMFHVDHDHATGEVRGLLCHSCNTAIGLMQENPERLQKLIAYLKPRLKLVA